VRPSSLRRKSATEKRDGKATQPRSPRSDAVSPESAESAAAFLAVIRAQTSPRLCFDELAVVWNLVLDVIGFDAALARARRGEHARSGRQGAPRLGISWRVIVAAELVGGVESDTTGTGRSFAATQGRDGKRLKQRSLAATPYHAATSRTPTRAVTRRSLTAKP
jgi:hypothetical protein